jgi:N6-adenosine-specific RNA methylase IME4
MLYEPHEYANLFPRLTEGELAELCASVKEHGLLTSIVLYQDRILDGRHRYEACQREGIEPRFEQFRGSDEEALAFVIAMNATRRHLTASQRAAIAVRLLPIYEAQAKERQRAAGGDRKSDEAKSLFPNLGKAIDPEPVHADRAAAAAMGVGHGYVSEAKRLQERAPELLQRVEAGELSLQEAKREVKKAEQAEVRAERRAAAIPHQSFNVIYADPPWQYNNSGFDGSAQSQYDTMPTGAICNVLQEFDIEENAVLFLWVTNPLLEDGLKVCKAWGFEYKTKFTWYKHQAPGLAFYGYSKTEDLWICSRGSFLPEYKPVLYIDEQRTFHSRKPQQVYDIIERMYPGASYLELFARQVEGRERWTFWGNDV